MDWDLDDWHLPLDYDEPIESDDDDNEDEVVVRVPKRYIRDNGNPFEFFTEIEFKRRYRFHKDAILNGILPRIEHGLVKLDQRGLPISPVLQLLVCLRFYATANFQLVCGDLMSFSQSTVSRIVFRVSNLLAAMIHEYIKIPASQEGQTENRQLFRELGADRNGVGLPGIDGAIDCTHIRLTHKRFQQFQEVFRNGKGYFSLNIQAVVGPRMEFLDIVPEWPGSKHDSRIFQNSRIFMRYREWQLTEALIGDAGYPSLPFLFTPIANPGNDAEERYNLAQGKTRRIVERTFGIWKRRFPCLSRGLANKLLRTTTIIVACAVLHNMSLIIDNGLPEDDEPYAEDEVVPVNPFQLRPGEGFAVRRALIERLYGEVAQ